ncbi:hypothetical protein B0H34DRAFT_85266 [Crassisporium funariophilum]|nr:hypothetical protein B0H34DRAFT_85266 [Crassisporium funariophilum]
MVDHRWLVIYEGKGANSNDSYANIQAQLKGYGSALANGRWCYAIAAKGRTCKNFKFVRYDMFELKPMRIHNNGVQILDGHNIQDLNPFDIENDANAVADIMVYITNNQPQ